MGCVRANVLVVTVLTVTTGTDFGKHIAILPNLVSLGELFLATFGCQNRSGGTADDFGSQNWSGGPVLATFLPKSVRGTNFWGD